MDDQSHFHRQPPPYASYDPRTGMPLPYAYAPPRPHSGPGIASLVLSVVGLAIMLITLIVGAMVEMTNPGVLDDEDAPETLLVGCALLSALLPVLVAIVLGVVGLVLPGRQRLTAVVGLVIGGLTLFGVAALTIIGALMG